MRNSPSSAALAFALLCLIFAPYPVVYAQEASEGERLLTLVAAGDAVKYLTPSSPTAGGSLQIDTATEVTVTFGSYSKTLDVTLFDPQGVGVSVRGAGTASVSPWFDPNPYDSSDTAAVGGTYSFTLRNPVPGLWTYLVAEPSAITAPIAVMMTMHSTSSVRSGIIGARREYVLEDDITLGVVTVDGSSPLLSVSIAADLTKSGSSTPVASVTFLDNGQDGDGAGSDGLYSALIVPPSPGEYAVTATVSGLRLDGQAFVRVVSTSFSVKTTKARLLGGFDERVVGSPLIDGIGVAPHIDVKEAGTYRVTVMLMGSNGRFASASASAALAVGERSIESMFTGRRIVNEIGANGPYRLNVVRLERVAGDTRELLDENANAGDTASYSLSSFASDPVLSLGSAYLYPIDTNGNTKIDQLDLEVVLTLAVAGSYSWSAQLVTLSGVVVTTATSNGTLPAVPGTPLPATENIHLLFSGLAVGGSGLDGPYRVRLFEISGTGGSSTFPEVCMTPRFLASDFEGFCTLGCPSGVTVGTGSSPSGCGVVVNYTPPSATANCGPVTCEPTSGSVFPVGTTTVSCSAASAFTCSFAVTVSDTTAPSVSCPAASSATVGSGCQVAIPNVLAGASATDNCTAAGSLTFSQSPAAGTLVGPGAHTITVSATDASGNIGTCTTTFTASDAQPPTITGPVPAIYLRTSNSAGGATVTFPLPSASDNCAAVNVNAAPASGTTFPNGKTLVTATATDAAGLTASTQFTVKVVRFGESIGIYIPSTAGWFLRNTNTDGAADLTFSFGPGGTGWVPIAGDWDRSGTDTPGLFYNPTAGVFLSDTNGPGGANYVFSYGPSGSSWIPLAGDWNGEGVDSIGLYDPSTGNFFLKNINAAGNADVILQLGPGNAGFLPIVGDWNGDGIDTVGIYNPETGVFFLRNSNTNGPADLTFTYGAGGKGYLPISGDWNGDNICTIGLYDPSTGAFLLRNSNDEGDADVELTFGPSDQGAVPVAGSWDGQ